MVNKTQIFNGIDTYLDKCVSKVFGDSKIFKLFEPWFKKGISSTLENHREKLDVFLNMIADKDGNINIDNIFNDAIEHLSKMDIINFNNKWIGDIRVGKGEIKLDAIKVPFSGGEVKQVRFTGQDLLELKQTIINSLK